MNDSIYYCFQATGLELFRFYPAEKIVINVSTNAQSLDAMPRILSWFYLGSDKRFGEGHYKISGQHISFEAVSEVGKVVYSGTIQEGTLLLHSHSFINGHKATSTFRLFNNDPADTNIGNTPGVIQHTTNTGYSGKKRWRYLVVAFVLMGIITYITRTKEGCRCQDGTTSTVTSSEACAHHGGVMSWKYKYWWNSF